MEMSVVAALIAAAVAVFFYMRWRVVETNFYHQTLEIQRLQRDQHAINTRLAALERQIAAVYTTVFDGIVVVNAQHELLSINPAALEYFNISTDYQGKTLIQAVQNHELDDLVNEALATDELMAAQLTLNDRQYRVRALRWMYEDNGKWAVMVVLEDVSELVRLTRARRDMVANISHDLRNPISSIRLLLDTLTTNYGKNAERDHRLLGKMTGEIDNLQHMTRELIDLSSIESGKAIMRMVNVPLDDIIASAIEMMLTQSESHKLTIINDAHAGQHVLADFEQTRRVLTNIIHNAIKFTPSSGQITIRTSDDAGMARVCITDTGPGIPPHERQRVFERFYQVDTSRTGVKSESGSGLGLSIAKHIIEAQGGKIWADASPEGGAVICFTLALAEALNKNA